MNIRNVALLTSAAIALGGAAYASESSRRLAPLELVQSIPEEPVYGAHLMTERERDEHRAQMRAAASESDRERIRAMHHEQMQRRAKERGMMLPDAPPARGPGKGPGPGGGMGPGSAARQGADSTGV